MTGNDGTRNSRRLWLLRLAIGLFIVAVVIARGDVSRLLKALSRVSLWVPLIAVLFLWLSQCLSVLKFQLLLKARGANFSFVECVRLYLLGMFWNLWMPTTIGGDAMRAVAAGPRCGGVAAAGSAILVERLTGLVALLVVGSTGIVLWGSGHTTLGLTALPRVGVVLLVTGIGFFLLRSVAYRVKPSNHRIPRLLGKIASLFRELDFYARRERTTVLALSLILSLLFQGAQVGLQLYLARAVGMHTPVLVFFWLVPLLALMSMVPIGIGGLGVREVAAVSILSGTENSAVVVAWSLLWQVTNWLSSLCGIFEATKVSSFSD